MIDLGPHATFIVWAYLGVLLAICGLIGWILYDGRRTARKLAALEAQRPAR
jgi:heme exporter protein CcmD